MNSDEKVLEVLELPHGIECDADEAWPKLTTRQFPGDPGRGCAELIQNAIDAYPADTPFDRRSIQIETMKHPKRGIAVTDYGEGMPLERLRLLATLGGTDKRDNPNKIGRYGIGFFSMFSPRLQTRLVRVTTRCEGYVVELTFNVLHPEKPPRISHRILDAKIDFSTRVEVEFDVESSVVTCLDHARRYLKYYPCPVTIDGRPCATVWQEARRNGARFFKKDANDGFLCTGIYYGSVTLLCKYEIIGTRSVTNFINGGRDCTDDLRDYRRRSVPWLSNVDAVLNCNNLNLTISRDSWWLDWAWEHAVRALAEARTLELGRLLAAEVDPKLVIANQYALAGLVKPYVRPGDDTDSLTGVEAVYRDLAEARVYHVTGHREPVSLKAIATMRSPETPLFFSPGQVNVRWLGGDFKHDFVILPPPCSAEGGAPGLYDDLFATVFDDVVNLDTIADNQEKIAKLVERGVVDRAALMPACKMVGSRALQPDEGALLRELNELLDRPRVLEAINRELHMPVRSVRSVFFDVENEEITVATGLFDEAGTPIDETAGSAPAPPQNLAAEEPSARPGSSVLLGLRRNHPLVQRLVSAANDPHRRYFALTYLSGELTRCQRRLVPQSRFFHVVKDRLAAAMRQALLNDLVPPSGAAAGTQ